MPENPNSYLPQSAAVLGQAPLGVIRPANVNISVPNPLDIANFYRTQQDMQGNLALAQRQQSLMMDRERLDMQNYELLVNDMSSMMGAMGSGFDSLYEQKKQGAGGAMTGGIFGNLDPRNTKHAELINKYQDSYNAMQDEAFRIMQSYVSSGVRDPGQRMEAVHQVNRLKNDFSRQLMMDPEFRRQNEAAMNYQAYLDGVKAMRDEGMAIDEEAFMRTEKLYQDYVNGVPGTKTPGLLDFDVNKTVYNGTNPINNIANDAKAFAQDIYSSRLQAQPDGSYIEVQEGTTPTEEDVLDAFEEKYMNDRNAQLTYKNTVQGRVFNPDGSPMTFRDWVGTQVMPYVKPYLRPEGEETYINDYGTQYKPVESKAASSSGAKSGSGPREDGNWFNVADEKGRANNVVAQTLDGMGYDVGNDDLHAVSLIGENPEAYGYELYEDEDGDSVMGVFKYEIDPDTKQRIYENGVAKKASDTPMHTFTTKPPAQVMQLSPDAKKWGPGDHGIERENRGSRNNNPGNVRATQSQLDRGDVRVDEKGFIIFDSIEEGLAAMEKELDTKINGNSNAMKNSAYMKARYGKQQAQNYADVATVQDFINVYAPSSDYGGDNTPEEVANYIQSLASDGVHPDKKLSELTPEDKQKLIQAMVKVECPHCYQRLWEPDSLPNVNVRSVENPLTGEETTIREFNGRKYTVKNISQESPKSNIDW